jgi:hypothetical protein
MDRPPVSRSGLRGRARTLGALVAHLVRRQGWFFVPLLFVLLLAALLLLATQGAGYVAPFVYTLF